MTVRKTLALIVAAALCTVAAACAPTPLSPPRGAAPKTEPLRVKGGGPATGTVEAVRQQLLGTWDLAELQTVPPGGGPRVPIKATGTLVYDAYGNLTIDARTTDAGAPVAAREVSLLTFKGRAVIDAANQELQLMNMTGNVDPSEVIAPERRRKYELVSDTLTLSTLDSSGEVISIATWRRRPS